MQKHIFLTGFMGAGKTTVGQELANLLGWPLVDTDELAVRREGRSIAKIFEKSGEGYFRRLENFLLKELSKQPSAVVSCGGGIAIREENVDVMKSCGQIVYLEAAPKTILARVMHTTHRPLLEGKKNVADISAMMEARVPYYAKAADVTICVDGKEKNEIAREIKERLKLS